MSALLSAHGEPLDPAEFADELALDAFLSMIDYDSVDDPELYRRLAETLVSGTLGSRYASRGALTMQALHRMLRSGLLVPHLYRWAPRLVDFSMLKVTEENIVPAAMHCDKGSLAWDMELTEDISFEYTELIGCAAQVNSASLMRHLTSNASWRRLMTKRKLLDLHKSLLMSAAYAHQAYIDDAEALEVFGEVIQSLGFYWSTLIYDRSLNDLFYDDRSRLLTNASVCRWALSRARIISGSDFLKENCPSPFHEIRSFNHLVDARYFIADSIAVDTLDALYRNALRGGHDSVATALLSNENFVKLTPAHVGMPRKSYIIKHVDMWTPSYVGVLTKHASVFGDSFATVQCNIFVELTRDELPESISIDLQRSLMIATSIARNGLFDTTRYLTSLCTYFSNNIERLAMFWPASIDSRDLSLCLSAAFTHRSLMVFLVSRHSDQLTAEMLVDAWIRIDNRRPSYEYHPLPTYDVLQTLLSERVSVDGCGGGDATLVKMLRHDTLRSLAIDLVTNNRWPIDNPTLLLEAVFAPFPVDFIKRLCAKSQ